MLTRLTPIILTVILMPAAFADDALPQPTREVFNCSADGSKWPYLMQLAEGDPTAVLIYLHGHYSDETQGMTPGIYEDAFGKLRRECSRRNWAYVCGYYGGNTWMNQLGEDGLADLIGILRGKYPGKKVYLSGGSMGGSSALVFAVRRPDLIDGVIALCPAGDMESYYAFAAASDRPVHANISAAIRMHYQIDGHGLATELEARSALQHADRLTMPVVISHGTADESIPIDATRRLVIRLQELGGRVDYTEIAGGGHDAPILGIDWTPILDFVEAGEPETP